MKDNTEYLLNALLKFKRWVDAGGFDQAEEVERLKAANEKCVNEVGDWGRKCGTLEIEKGQLLEENVAWRKNEALEEFEADKIQAEVERLKEERDEARKVARTLFRNNIHDTDGWFSVVPWLEGE